MENKYLYRVGKKEYGGRYAAHAALIPSFRAQCAWELIRHFGAVAGKRFEGGKLGEDKDPGIQLQTPEELVDRCFTITDLYLDRCEKEKEFTYFPDDVGEED